MTRSAGAFLKGGFMKSTNHIRAFHKAWKLSDTVYSQTRPNLRWKNRIRFSLTSLMHADETMEWFSMLETTDWMHPFLEKMPVLTFKPMRVYLSTKWNLAQRKKVIWDTYHLLQRYPVFCKTILNTHGTVLARYDCGKYGDLAIVLCSHHHSTSKEGELMVKLRNNSQDRDIIKMAFSFERSVSGDFICYIGCIQGSGTDNRDEIKAITKAMHGLRPAALMIFIAREIISAMDIKITHILGLGNQAHPFRKKHLIHIPFAHQISFDYDALWQDAGGKLEENGWFCLPVKSERRESKDIKSKKKMVYLRRYGMMDELSKQIHQNMSGIFQSGS